MDGPAQSPLHEELEAAFGWWREAGVDCDFSDTPANWLDAAQQQAQPEQEAPAPAAREERPAPAPPPRVAVDTSALPGDLEGFTRWWMSCPGLDGGRTSGRIAPRGVRGANLMVVVPEPEREDTEKLLSGPQGELLANVLNAAGIGPDDVYVASAIPRHLPGADWAAIAATGISEVLRHHAALVSPKRVIAFGGNILPLFGNHLPQDPAPLREINLEGQSIPLLAARDLSVLLERPRWKGALWKSWLGWTGQAAMG